MTLARCVVADPPWPYGDAGRQHTVIPRCIKQDGELSIGVADWTYKPLSLDGIKALPVSRLVEPAGAHLYLWTTNAFMVEAHEVARAWGFEPKTILTWGKVCHDDPLRPSMKTGYYFRGATEHVIFAVRGSLRLQDTLPTLFLWPRIQRHSEKPEGFYGMVSRASPGPYVELFARTRRPGWFSWGNQLD